MQERGLPGASSASISTYCKVKQLDPLSRFEHWVYKVLAVLALVGPPLVAISLSDASLLREVHPIARLSLQALAALLAFILLLGLGSEVEDGFKSLRRLLGRKSLHEIEEEIARDTQDEHEWDDDDEEEDSEPIRGDSTRPAVRGQTMTVNVFEGARRIVWIIAVLWVLVVCGYNFSDRPSVRLRYIVEGLDYVPIRMKDGEDCSYDDAEEGRSLATDKGTDVWLSLCFKAHTSDSGEAGMIPYRKATNIEEAAFLEARFEKTIRPRINPKLVLEAKQAYLRENAGTILYMGKEGNPEVSSYTNRVAEQFALPDKDEEWADSQWWPEFFKKIKNALNATVGGWVVLWLLTWVIGWVVRGFLGIPIGHDRRIEKG